MSKLRRLSGLEVIAILQEFGFVVARVRGSHHRLKLALDDQICYTTVSVHGNRPLPTGTLRAILRQVAECIAEDEINSHFYTS